jgi:hypothetical protein
LMCRVTVDMVFQKIRALCHEIRGTSPENHEI